MVLVTSENLGSTVSGNWYGKPNTRIPSFTILTVLFDESVAINVSSFQFKKVG